MNSLIDETGKIWEWRVLSQRWCCVNGSGFNSYPTLEELDNQQGPLYKVVRGDKVRTVPVIGETVQVLVDGEVKAGWLYADVDEIYEDEVALRIVVPRERIKLLEYS